MMQTLAQNRTNILLYMLTSQLLQQEKNSLASLLGHNGEKEIEELKIILILWSCGFLEETLLEKGIDISNTHYSCLDGSISCLVF